MALHFLARGERKNGPPRPAHRCTQGELDEGQDRPEIAEIGTFLRNVPSFGWPTFSAPGSPTLLPQSTGIGNSASIALHLGRRMCYEPMWNHIFSVANCRQGPPTFADMDVDIMKKTSTRLATLGVFIALGAFAIALAHHDSRNRDDSEPTANAYTATEQKPIPVEGDWVLPDRPEGEYGIVRANNNDLPPGPLAPDFPTDSPQAEAASLPVLEFPNEPAIDENPLRGAAYHAELSDAPAGMVVKASGEGPATGQPNSPPAWLAEGGENAGVPSLPELPTLDSGTARNSASPSQPPSTAPAAIPSFPMAGPAAPTDLPAAAATDLPAAAATDLPAAAPRDQRAFSQAGAGQATPVANAPVPRGQPKAVSGAQLALVSNQPGSRYLDGSQNPMMLIQKCAAEEIQVGKKTTIVITVRNAGNATAHDVRVVDTVPSGARFEDAAPPVVPGQDGLLVWELGEMAAGDEKTISLQITPQREGEVGSVASVHFAALASVRTIATLPKIEILTESQPDVLIGSSQSIVVTMKNTGTGVARNVRLEADIPQQLKHESGESQLDAPIGDLRPHESIQRTLSAAAVQAGVSQCIFRAVTDDGVQSEASVAVDVRAPQLAATIQGPTLRYLERQATYRIDVDNTGTAAATDLNFTLRLPTGLKYISTNVPAEYDPNAHAVTLWLEELPAGRQAPIELTVLPIDLGPQVITFAANAALGASAEAKYQVRVDGLAELAYTIGQDNGTIEIGATSTYSVQVTNVGNKPDKNVQLSVQLPAGAQLVDVDAQGIEYRAEGNRLIFAPIAEMQNKDQRTFRFELRHQQPGNQIVRTQLTSQNWPDPIIKDAGTLVYNDRN